MSLTFYDQDQFSEIKTVSAQYLMQLAHYPVTDLISNVTTEIAAFTLFDQIYPFTINNTEYRNALICSPYTTYITYPLGELKKFKKRWIQLLILLNTGVMSFLCRMTKMNRIVQVNNHLNSLIKHPNHFSQAIAQLTENMTQKYVTHGVLFFRINDHLDKSLLSALKENGYIVFPDRVAHIFIPNNCFMKRSHTKRDMSLLRKSQYSVVQHENIALSDAGRLAELYRQLFVDKHSQLNPIYTETYFREALKNHWHEYVALRSPEGRIDAFISWFDKEEVMVCGPLGYAHEVPEKEGLYRQLVALCLQRSHEKQMIFNMGGGSDHFKRNRGSTETLEYTAIYCRHLPFYRKWPWRILRFCLSRMLTKITASADF